MSVKSEPGSGKEPQVTEGCDLQGNDPIHDLSTLIPQSQGLELDERIKILYPTVSEAETPLPRQWSSEDKAAQIELSRNDRRAHGPGSVRAAHPIPIDCPGYYFEVDIVSRSAVVGLSAASTTNGNSMDRWVTS